jgi:hypothetical protein
MILVGFQKGADFLVLTPGWMSPAMPHGPEDLDVVGGAAADPLLLAILLVIFIVGAVVPLAGALWASVRDDRAARREMAERAARGDQEVTNPVAANIVTAVETLDFDPIGPDTLGAAANDEGPLSVAGGAR